MIMSSQASVKLEKSRELILGRTKISRHLRGTKCITQRQPSLGLVGPVPGLDLILLGHERGSTRLERLDSGRSGGFDED